MKKASKKSSSISKNQQKQIVNIFRNAEQKMYKFLFQNKQCSLFDLHASHINSQWLIISRVLIFLLLTSRYCWQISEYTSLFNNVEYLTEVGYFTAWIYFTISVQDYFAKKYQLINQKLKNYALLVFETGFCLSFPITLLYWIVLFDGSNSTPLNIFKDIGVHGFPLFCLLIDFIFNTCPFPKRHLIPIFCFSSIYLMINLIYSLEVKPIYEPIDWISFMCYVWIALCVIIAILVHYIGQKTYQKYKKPLITEHQDTIQYDNETNLRIEQ